MNDEFSADRLGIRLREYAAANAGDVNLLVRRVLDRQQQPFHQSRALRLALSSTLALSLSLVLMVAGAYLSPRLAIVLADTPIASTLLREIGLADVADRVAVSNDVAISNGMTLILRAAYADESRIVVLLGQDPGVRVDSAEVSLRDQFMRSYTLRSITTNLATGESALEFSPLEQPTATWGARLTLAVHTIYLERSAQVITGNWSLRTAIVLDSGEPLSTVSQVQVGDMTFNITSLRRLPAGILLQMDTAQPISRLTQTIPDGAKGRPAFTIQLRLRDASAQAPQFMELAVANGTTRVTGFWPVQFDAAEKIVVGYEGVGAAELAWTRH